MTARKLCKVTLVVLGLFLGACGLLWLVFESLFGPLVEWKETQRLASPDGRVEAVVVQSDGGATTSVGCHIHVVPRNGRAHQAQGRAALVYGCTNQSGEYGVDLHWASPTSLAIGYRSARWSVVDRPVVEVAGRRIRIRVVGRHANLPGS